MAKNGRKPSIETNVKENVAKVLNPVNNTKKSKVSRPKSKHIKGRKKSFRSKELQIVHNLDGKMGKPFI